MLSLKVEFMAGDTIEEAAFQMKRLATLLHICIEGKFNGVHIFAYENFSEAHIVKQYKDGLKQLKP